MKKIFHIILMFQFILVWSQDIKKIDSLIINSIELSAFPGAQVYIKKGDFKFKITDKIYQKPFKNIEQIISSRFPPVSA